MLTAIEKNWQLGAGDSAVFGTPSPAGIRRGVEKVVGGDVVEPAEGHQMPDGQLVGAPLVTGVHGLGGAQDLGHLGLGQVVVLPQPPELFLNGLHNACTSDGRIS